MPGRSVTLAVPWPAVIAASPETAQRNVRSPFCAAGIVAVRVVALVAIVELVVIAPAVSAETTVTVAVGL